MVAGLLEGTDLEGLELKLYGVPGTVYLLCITAV